MFFGIKSLFYLVLLSVVSLTGCNSSSSKKKQAALNIDAGDAINSHNKGSYTFSGPCVENGENNIEYSVASSGSSQGAAALTGSIGCTEGKWKLPFSTLAAISDGEVTLSLSSSNLSASLTVTKDTQAPVLSSVSANKNNGSFTLSCDGTNGCDASYKYRWVVINSGSHTFGNEVAFSAVALNSLFQGVSNNGDDLYLHVQVQDKAGNTSAVVKSSRITNYDNVPPSISGVRGDSSNSNTSYGKQGDTVTLSVSFNENVLGSGRPSLNLGSGRRADCTNCDGSTARTTMTFNYQVAATDNGGLELEGFIFVSAEKIVDEGGNSVPQPSSPITVSGITLDTTVPSVTNLALTNSSNIWSWSWGCSEASCKYRHEIKTSTSPATLSGNYGAEVTAAPAGSSVDGTYYAHVQAKDAAGNESVVVASGANSIPVGGTPVVKTLSGPVLKTYNVGESLDFQVTFDRSVAVTEVPQLPLQIGSVNRYANYFSGTNSNTLIFRYAAVSGDTDSDGVALRSGSINLNGGGLNGSTTVSLTGKTFTGVLVDTVPPVVTITSTHTDVITSSNAAAYSVSGACEAGLPVEVRVGTVAPDSAPTCSGSGTWEATLNLGALEKGATTITASQTDSVGTGSASPVSVTVGDFEQMAIRTQRISVGYNHSCVVKSDGKVSCWGDNSLGQLGNNSTSHSDYPVDVRDGTGNSDTTLQNIVQVSAGDRYTCAVNSEGNVLCWGGGWLGRLGNNLYRDHKSQLYPRAVNGINNNGTLSGMVQVHTGRYHTCALGENGQVSCWGLNTSYQLGRRYVNYNESYYPKFVRTSQNGPPLKGIVQVVVGTRHTCALTSGKKVLCWGKSNDGRLGNGSSANGALADPVAVLDSSGVGGSTLSDVIQVSGGIMSSCALKASGTIYCWGEGYFGDLPSEISTSSYPLLVNNLSNVRAITQSYISGSNQDITCVLDSDRQAKCWGDNRSGQLTRGTVTNNGVSPADTGLATTIRGDSTAHSVLQSIVEIGHGNSNSCALMATGKVKCWGSNAQIGVGGGGYTLYPVEVPSSGSNSDFVPGVRSSHYVCREGLSRCVLSPVSLAPGGGQSNYITNEASPAISIFQLGTGEALTLYSDSTCLSSLPGGSVAGASASNPQTVTLNNAVIDREIPLYYKIGGNNEVNDTLCFKSAIVFDRLAPPAPSSIYFGDDGPAGDATTIVLSSLPTGVKVKVEGNSADSVKEYTAEVYLENSTCDNSSAMVASGNYHSDATLELSFDSGPHYVWDSTSVVPIQSFKFYAKSIDAAGNGSSCTESLPVWMPKP